MCSFQQKWIPFFIMYGAFCLKKKLNILANADKFYYLPNVKTKAQLKHSQVGTDGCFMTLRLCECVSIAAQTEHFSYFLSQIMKRKIQFHTRV